MVKKVLHIITGLGHGGAESMLIRLLGELKDKYELKVIVLGSDMTRAEEIRRMGLKVETIQLNTSLPGPFSIFKLIRKIYKFNPDIVQTWMYHADLLGGVAARLAGDYPVIWSLRQSDFGTRPGLKIKLGLKLSSLLAKFIPKKIISCSQAGANFHIGQGYPEEKITVIPNAYETEKFKFDPQKRTRLRSQLNITDDDFLIGMVARFHPQKGHRTFIRAASLLAGENETVRFLLCGKDIDDSNEKLTGWLEEAKVRDRFFLLGERDDIVAINCALDLATLSSTYGEGFPNAVAEAMACETPGVVTDIGDSATIVGDTGIVVPAENPGALTEGWRKFIAMPTEERKKRGRQARRRIKENYSMQAVIPRFEKVYGEVTKSNG